MSVFFVFKPSVESRDHSVGHRAESKQRVDVVCKHVAASVVCKVHTEAEFRIVFKQGVCPCRTATFVVLGVGASRCAAAVNGGATGCVCDEHSVAEQLRHEFDVRSLAAACACAGELEERLLELAVLDVDGFELCSGLFELCSVIPVCFVGCDSVVERNHGERFFFGRADSHAVGATRAVERADLHTEFVTFHADSGLGDETFGLVCKLFCGCERRTNCRVRANERAAVALNALVGIPNGNCDCDAAFFKLGRAGGYVTVGVECGNGEFVAFLCRDGCDEGFEVFIVGDGQRICALGCGLPALRIFDFFKVCDRLVHASVVHCNDSVAFLAVGLFDHFLHIAFCIFVGDDVCKLEECRLHDGVDALLGADLLDDFQAIESVEFDVFLCDHVLHCRREFCVHFFGLPLRVEKERAAVFKVGEHVIAENV